MRTGAPGSFVKSRLTTKECLLPIFKSPKERNKWKESMYKRKVGYITCRHIFATDKGSVCVCVCVCVYLAMVAQMVKNLPAMWETQIRSLG